MDRFQDKQTFHRNAGAVGAASDGMAPGQVYTAVVQSKEDKGVATVTIPALHLSYTFQAKVNVGVTVGATVLVIFDENKTPWILGGGPPLVTALPASPVNEQEIYFLADATNGVRWHLSYRAASASAYKWEFLGGGPLNSYAGPEVTTESEAYVALAGGPLVTLPLAGDFEISHSVQARCEKGNGWALQTIKLGAAAADDQEAAAVMAPVVGGEAYAISTRTMVRYGLASGAKLEAQYRRITSKASFTRREMVVRPVRVG